MGRSWYPWEFQQIVRRHDFQKKNYLDVVYQKLKHLFNIHFEQSSCVRTIRMAFNKIDFQMTGDKVSKFTWSIFIEKGVINDVKKPGLQFIVEDGCIKCRKVVSFYAIDFGIIFGISSFLKVL